MQAHNTITSEDTTTAESPAQGGFGVGFLSNLAHQLRSPLSSLRVWVDLLGDPAALASPEDTKRLVEGIDRATSRLERQISDVLEIGYLEAGTLTFETGPVDAVEQIVRAIADADHAARSRRIKFDLKFGEQSAIVLSSDSRLRQILGCLFSNAIRFSPVDGTISVTVGTEPRIAGGRNTTTIIEPQFSRITELSLVPEKGMPERARYICVSNSGPTIPSELHHEIFRPFQRAVRKDAHGGGGSGLGLAIAIGLVKLHGGGMWLRSNPGDGPESGAEFEFALPAVEVEPEANPVPAGNQLN